MEFELPIRYFVRKGVAWDDGNPAKGFRRTTTGVVKLDTADTAIACVHLRPDSAALADGWPSWSSGNAA
jgi:hypothetical protein